MTTVTLSNTEFYHGSEQTITIVPDTADKRTHTTVAHIFSPGGKEYTQDLGSMDSESTEPLLIVWTVPTSWDSIRNKGPFILHGYIEVISKDAAGNAQTPVTCNFKLTQRVDFYTPILFEIENLTDSTTELHTGNAYRELYLRGRTNVTFDFRVYEEFDQWILAATPVIVYNTERGVTRTELTWVSSKNAYMGGLYNIVSPVVTLELKYRDGWTYNPVREVSLSFDLAGLQDYTRPYISSEVVTPMTGSGEMVVDFHGAFDNKMFTNMKTGANVIDNALRLICKVHSLDTSDNYVRTFAYNWIDINNGLYPASGRPSDFPSLMINEGSFNGSIHLTDLNYQKNYIFEFQVEDRFSWSTSQDVPGSSMPLFSWDSNDFEFNIPTFFNEGAYFRSGSGLGTEQTPNLVQVTDEATTIGYPYYSQENGVTRIYGNEVDIFSHNPLTINGKTLGEQHCLWSGVSQMGSGQTIELSEPISAQMHGVVLVFCLFRDFAEDLALQTFFVSKEEVRMLPGTTHTYMMNINGGFSIIGAKYLYIYDDHITGHSGNTQSGNNSGITYDNTKFVLRFVIGV